MSIFKSQEQQEQDINSLELYKRIDPETYFHGLQLINKIEGADTYEKVNELDRILSHERYLELGKEPLQGNFDLAHFKAIHGYLFQDIYYFAGQLRDLPMEIDPVTRFVPPHRIQSSLDIFFEKLKQTDFLRGLDKDSFITQMAQRLTDINIIHPFREGNGRSKRVFFSELAKNAGYELDWERCAKEEWKFADECAFDSSRDGKRDISYLKYLLDKAVSPLGMQISNSTKIQIGKSANKQKEMEME